MRPWCLLLWLLLWLAVPSGTAHGSGRVLAVGAVQAEVAESRHPVEAAQLLLAVEAAQPVVTAPLGKRFPAGLPEGSPGLPQRLECRASYAGADHPSPVSAPRTHAPRGPPCP